MTDTGLASALLGLDLPALSTNREMYGQLLETFVYLALRRQANWEEADYRFYHFRDKDNYEIDLVIERADRTLCAVEVKAGATVGTRDFKALRRLRDATGDRLFAIPFQARWNGKRITGSSSPLAMFTPQ